MKFQITNIDFNKTSYSNVQVVEADSHIHAYAQFLEMTVEELLSESQPEFTGPNDNENLKYIATDGEGVVIVLKLE